MIANKEIRDALQTLNSSMEAANDAASDLFAEILRTQRSLVSEATIVRETATLLRHVIQNFCASLATQDGSKFDKQEILHDARGVQDKDAGAILEMLP